MCVVVVLPLGCGADWSCCCGHDAPIAELWRSDLDGGRRHRQRAFCSARAGALRASKAPAGRVATGLVCSRYRARSVTVLDGAGCAFPRAVGDDAPSPGSSSSSCRPLLALLW